MREVHKGRFALPAMLDWIQISLTRHNHIEAEVQQVRVGVHNQGLILGDVCSGRLGSRWSWRVGSGLTLALTTADDHAAIQLIMAPFT